MTEEEMRAKITEQEKSISTLKEERDLYKSQIETKDNEINSLKTNVSELKQKNYDLFIQIPTKIETNQNDENNNVQNTKSISDIVSNMLGKNN